MTRDQDMPPRYVEVSANMLGLIGAYGIVMGLILLLVGSFSGLHVFVAGAAHLLVAVASIVLRSKLLKRLRWAQLATIFGSAIVALLLIGVIAYSWADASGDLLLGIAFFTLIAIFFGVISVLLCVGSSRSWFRDT